MQRLLFILAVVIPACGGSGFDTGMAMLSSSTKIKSASAKPFTGADAMGNQVLGWTIDFHSASPGSDCMDDGIDKLASIGIFTNQAKGSAKVAMLQTGDFPIVKMSPPPTTNGTAVTMGIDMVSGVVGTLTISDVFVNGDKPGITGSVNAGGTDSTGTGIAITGMFVAPQCGS